MRIPKYILHPTLLVIGGAIIMYFVWARVPSSKQIHETVEKTTQQTLQKPSVKTKVTKKDFSESYYIIGSVNGAGQLVLLPGSLQISMNDKRFTNISIQQQKQLNAFFKNRLIPKSKITKEMTSLDLPFVIYDQNCLNQKDPKDCTITIQK